MTQNTISGDAFHKATIAELSELKQRYLQRWTAPMDGMWESFADAAEHLAIHHRGEVVGFLAVNADRKLLQFHVESPSIARPAFAAALEHHQIAGAVVSTADSPFLSLCLDHQQSVEINALMYQVPHGVALTPMPFPDAMAFRLVTDDQLPLAVDFAVAALGANRQWLTGYYTERIERQELWGVWHNGNLIAAGECRYSSSQGAVADLGMVVSKESRGQGLATIILRNLVLHCRERELLPICSTGRDNLAAQRAIEKAGFVSQHRILEVRFQADDQD